MPETMPTPWGKALIKESHAFKELVFLLSSEMFDAAFPAPSPGLIPGCFVTLDRTGLIA